MTEPEPGLDLAWWLWRTVPVHLALGLGVAVAAAPFPAAVVWGLLGWHLGFAVLALALVRRWWRHKEQWTAILVVNHLATFLALGLMT